MKGHIRSIYGRIPGDRRWEIVIRGANHFGFSDDGAILKSPMVIRVLRMAGILRLDGRRQLAVTSHYIQAFFDVYLKGKPASELEDGVKYPEAQYLR